MFALYSVVTHEFNDMYQDLILLPYRPTTKGSSVCSPCLSSDHQMCFFQILRPTQSHSQTPPHWGTLWNHHWIFFSTARRNCKNSEQTIRTGRERRTHALCFFHFGRDWNCTVGSEQGGAAFSSSYRRRWKSWSPCGSSPKLSQKQNVFSSRHQVRTGGESNISLDVQVSVSAQSKHRALSMNCLFFFFFLIYMYLYISASASLLLTAFIAAMCVAAHPPQPWTRCCAVTGYDV